MKIMKDLSKIYIGIGIGVATVSAIVLIKDGKDSLSKIAYYTALNGLNWPGAIYFGAKKAKELEDTRNSIS